MQAAAENAWYTGKNSERYLLLPHCDFRLHHRKHGVPNGQRRLAGYGGQHLALFISAGLLNFERCSGPDGRTGISFRRDRRCCCHGYFTVGIRHRRGLPSKSRRLRYIAVPSSASPGPGRNAADPLHRTAGCHSKCGQHHCGPVRPILRQLLWSIVHRRQQHRDQSRRSGQHPDYGAVHCVVYFCGSEYGAAASGTHPKGHKYMYSLPDRSGCWFVYSSVSAARTVPKTIFYRPRSHRICLGGTFHYVLHVFVFWRGQMPGQYHARRG